MKWVALSLLAVCPVVRAGEVVVGTFDSRAVAMAMARGEGFQKRMADLKAERDEAKAKGDEKRVAELEGEGPAIQKRLHRQVFGNEPIDDVLDLIREDLPKIAKDAGVLLLVSKWEVAYQSDDLNTVDVTWELVELFKPDDQTKKLIGEVMQKPPVPADELKHDH